MKQPLSLLDSIHVAEPCPKPWAGMAGDDKARFCTQCNKHVHDLSAMVRAEAEAFCRQNPTACIRFTRSEDGVTLTVDSARPSRLRKWLWVVPTWLGFGMGCNPPGLGMSTTMGDPRPSAVGKQDDASVRSAEAAARDLGVHIGRPLGDVTAAFGLDLDDAFAIRSTEFGGIDSAYYGVRIISSAHDFVEVYIARPAKGQWEGVPDLLRRERVTGIAVQSANDQKWREAGSIDKERYR